MQQIQRHFGERARTRQNFFSRDFPTLVLFLLAALIVMPVQGFGSVSSPVLEQPSSQKSQSPYVGTPSHQQTTSDLTSPIIEAPRVSIPSTENSPGVRGEPTLPWSRVGAGLVGPTSSLNPNLPSGFQPSLAVATKAPNSAQLPSGESPALTGFVSSHTITPVQPGIFQTSPPIYEPGSTVATVDLPSASTPQGVAYDPLNGDVYVAEIQSNNVTVISGSTIVANIPVDYAPVGVTYNPQNGEIYVAVSASNEVAVISGTKIVSNITVGSSPSGLVYDGQNGDMYVTNSGSSSVSVISGNSVIANIGVGTAPFGLAYDSGNGYVYVANYASAYSTSNTVSVISGTSLVTTITVGSAPYDAAYDSATGIVYVTNEFSNSVSLISGTTVTATINTGPAPTAVAYDSGNGYVYVTNSGTYSDNVDVLSGSSILTSIVVGYNPFSLAYDSRDGALYVANFASNTVSIVSTILSLGSLGGSIQRLFPTLAGSVTVQSSPIGVTYDAGNGYTYATDSAENNVSVLSGTNVVTTIRVGTNPLGVIYDGANGNVYVSNVGSGNVSVISGTTLVTSVRVGVLPIGLGVDSANGEIYVSNFGSSNVSVISGTTVVASVGVGNGPTAVAYDVANGFVYVTNGNSNNVSVISGTTVVANFGVGSFPSAVTYDSGNGLVYVANANTNNVSVIFNTSVVDNIPVGLSPFGLTYDLADGLIISANFGSGNVTFISSTSVVGSVAAGPNPRDLAYDSATGQTYVTDQGGDTVQILDTPWHAVASPGLEMDVGQPVLLTAPLLFSNPGIAGLSGTSSSPGLNCTTIGYTMSTANMICIASTAGTYTATLVATGTWGGSVWSETSLTVWSDPLVSIPLPTRGTVDVGQPVIFSTTASSGPGTYAHYTWSAPSALGCAASTSNTLSCLPVKSVIGATVTVNVTDTNNYTSASTSTSYTISADPTISGPMASPASLDVGQSTSFTVSATNGTGLPSTYTWTGLPPGCTPANALVLSCAPTSPGTYSISVSMTDSNGFTVSSPTLGLRVSPRLGIAVLSATRTALDVGQSVGLSASISGGTQAYGYAWKGLPAGCVSSNAASLSCTPFSPGSYVVQVWANDSNGASANATVTVVASADPTIGTPVASRGTLDVGENITLTLTATNGTGLASTITWQGLPIGCTSASVLSLTCAPTGTGSYIISASITDSNGYTSSSGTTTVTVSAALSTPTVVASVTTLDVGQSVTLSSSVVGGSTGYTYAWSKLPVGCLSGNTAVLNCVPTGVGAGTFGVSVTVTDSNGVSLTSLAVMLTVSTDPTISVPTASSTSLDVGQSVDFTSTATNGTGLASTIAWQGLPAGCTSSDAFTLTCTPTNPGTYAVSVAITDSNGMTVTSGTTALYVFRTLGTPTLDSSISTLDAGQAVTFSVSVSGGSTPLTYAWSGLPTGCVTGNTAALTCNPLALGTFTVSVNVTDANGVTHVSNSAKLVVSQHLSPGSLTLTPGTLDLGLATNLTVTVSGGSGGLSYQWMGLPSGCSSANKPSIVCTPTVVGTAWVSVEVTDSNGAIVTVGPVSFVTSPALGTPTVVASVSTVQVGGSVAFTASVSGGTGPLSYSWSGLPEGCASMNAPVVMCTPTTTGTYTVSVTVSDAAGAHTNSAGVPVTVTKAPTPATTGLSNGLDWGILGLAVVALVIAALGVLLTLRKGRKGEVGMANKGQEPPSSSPERSTSQTEAAEVETGSESRTD